MSENIRLIGWIARRASGETPAPVVEHTIPDSELEFTTPPTLAGTSITYKVRVRRGYFSSFNGVVDKLLLVGLNDSTEIVRHEETRIYDDTLWTGCVYEGEIWLPTDLPDGVYAAQVTVNAPEVLDPKPVGVVQFRVAGGAISPA